MRPSRSVVSTLIVPLLKASWDLVVRLIIRVTADVNHQQAVQTSGIASSPVMAHTIGGDFARKRTRQVFATWF